MTGFLKHAAIRVRWMAKDPSAMLLLGLAGLSSLLLWPWLVNPQNGPELQFKTMNEVLFLFLWPWLAVAPVTGARMCGGPRGRVLPAWALPALPVSRRGRVLAEVTAALIIIVVIRAPGFLFGDVGEVWIGPAALFGGNGPYALAFAGHTATCILLLLPLMVAWASPSRTPWFHLTKLLVATALVYSVLLLGWATDPVLLPTVSATLSAALLSLVGVEPELARRGGRAKGRRIQCHRTPRDPWEQFRRDRWLRPMRIVVPLALGVFVVSIGGNLLLRHLEFGVKARAMLGGLSVGILIQAFLFPLGINLLKGDQIAGTFMGGTFRAAWAALPVRPESVARTVYAHSWIAGALVMLLGACHVALAWSRGDIDADLPRYFFPLYLAMPSLAGLLTCIAVGDKIRGYFSLAALILVMPADIAVLIATKHAGITYETPLRLVINLAVLGVLALVGGLPPLVHLRRVGRASPGPTPAPERGLHESGE